MSKENSSQAAGVDYSTLVLGFSSAALSYLGVAPYDAEAKGGKNLTLAKQNIEIIALLKEKTKGNLSTEEAKLTDQILTDLRIKFVEAAK
jgi:hypothetical protein